MTELTLIMARGAFARFHRMRKEEGGATVLEWALIAAVVVVAASIVAAVIIKIVNDKTKSLGDCANQPIDTKCS